MAGNRRAKTFVCPACGKPQEIVALGHTSTYACPACSAIIDMADPERRIITKQQKAATQFQIPLGTRGTIRNVVYEVIGAAIKTEETRQYKWTEYLLFNPYHGFRWLVESNDHWNFGTPIKALPEVYDKNERLVADYNGAIYRRFVLGKSITVFIMGEFYWEARVGDSVEVADFIAPPFMLSTERTDDEVNWSLLEYMPCDDLKECFPTLKGIREPHNLASNQPNPSAERLKPVLVTTALCVLLLLFGEYTIGLFQNTKTVYQGTGVASAIATNNVIPDIVLTGRPSIVEVQANAAVNNSWVYLDLELINTETQESYGGDLEASYYTGTDSDGAWSEGSQVASVLIPAVPAGRYSLAIKPQVPVATAPRYSVNITRDVKYYSFMIMCLFFLAIYPLILIFKYWSFETARWAESDEST